uniref:Replication-associated protein n=1 Tax=Emberiza cioides CRESS-DNA-virus sp. TaxID=2815030 RepID=A0A8A4XCI5_9VIRU|nr:MAG: replication-associated protein [Emberiza cioides CRESS-DNA-virus sp.]
MTNSKNWCFTVFKDEVQFFDNEKIQYCIFGNEKCPKTGRWHKQGFAQFKTKQRLTALKKLDETAHWEAKRGTTQEAIDYCKKDGDYYETGNTVEHGAREGNEFKIVLELAKQGKFDEIENSKYLGTYIRYKKTFDSYDQRQYKDLDEPRGIWVHGKPGGGKDSNVKLKYNPYTKAHNKWWDGYNDEENVLWSDFDRNEMKYFFNYIKQWSDRYPFKAEYKGGSKTIHPKKFIVTSNHCLEDACETPMQHQALKRRFDEIDFDQEIVTKKPKMNFVNKQDLFNF